MSAWDILLGWPCGPVRVPAERRLRLASPSPRQALESVLAECLASPPCLVSFSGGRDSSALLALALHVARREALPEPVAFTLRYPGVAPADESSWQALVIDHLKPLAWEVVQMEAGSAQFLGPVATASLLSNGLLWPPSLHLLSGWLPRVRGATVIRGEGGDEVLGPHRATALRALVDVARHQPLALRPSLLRRAAGEAAPAPLRRSRTLREMRASGDMAWLLEPLRHEVLAYVCRVAAAKPWYWPAALRAHLAAPWLILGDANRDWLTSRYNVRFVDPLLDGGFVEALIASAGALGFPDRTEAMRALFGDLLPDVVLARKTKAFFNSAYHGDATWEFARVWDGTGVDASRVDVEVLRRIWLSDLVDARTTGLLQSAWLSCNAEPREPTRPGAG